MTKFALRQDVAREIVSRIEASFQADRLSKTTDKRPHVSAVIGCLKRSWRESRPGFINTDRSNPENMTLLRGHAWDAIADRAVNADYHPKIRVQSDYLVGEIDALGLIDGEPTVFDNKTTAAGPNGSKKQPAEAPLRWPHYVEQVAAYCVLLGLKRAALSILHLPMPTTFRVWDLKFTDGELAKWTAELKRRSAILLGDVEPSNAEHSDWLCGYCPFATANGGDCDGFGYGRPDGFFLIEADE